MVLELNASDDRGKQMHAAIFTSTIASFAIVSGLFNLIAYPFSLQA